MGIDYKVVEEAIHIGTTGKPHEALRVLESLEAMAESDIERGVILSAKSTCLAHLGKLSESLPLILEAKALVQSDRVLRSQAEMCEASQYVLMGNARDACAQFERISEEYADVLVEPEHHDFQQELLSRYACALVHAERFPEAVVALRHALGISESAEVQRLRLYLGIALAAEGKPKEAQEEFKAATSGTDLELSKMALEHLFALDTSQRTQ
jgi:tetratricopeptide (TPR) repeat protein